MLKFAICDDDPEVTTAIENQIQSIATKNRIDIDTETWLDPKSMCDNLEAFGIPDLIFLDIELGGTNGMEVSEHIREVMGNRYTSIVFISGKASTRLTCAAWSPSISS